jgi:hypothetical protein
MFVVYTGAGLASALAKAKADKHEIVHLKYPDERAAAASLWRALAVRRLTLKNSATTKALRSRELIPAGFQSLLYDRGWARGVFEDLLRVTTKQEMLPAR